MPAGPAAVDMAAASEYMAVALQPRPLLGPASDPKTQPRWPLGPALCRPLTWRLPGCVYARDPPATPLLIPISLPFPEVNPIMAILPLPSPMPAGPAAFDIAAASVYMAMALQPWIAVIVFVTLSAYIPMTIILTEWRSKFRRWARGAQAQRAARPALDG